ncbi:DUF4153 domain-containing protein [Pseudooceanicola nanhaiensis]|uniref:DUF4153 domain-containing protein n=1 Tax=Pseudooceanicola nanhaiensis TaxID=375761 RepID=UPI001CD4807C|nr:DUF4153 domain-containing protein [Pseudooceanicola nanhaiensis]MCA0920108.1 DUF4153 domain-containing protein [Pseudooceanicola nanhaiensis]
MSLSPDPQSQTPTQPPTEAREGTHLAMALVGLAAGLSFWILAEVLPDVIGTGRLLLWLACVALAGFAAFLALSGPARMRQAGLAALILALPLSGLVLLASLRYDDPRAFVQSGYWFGAYLIVLYPGMSFLAAAFARPGGASDPALLFDAAWTILLRLLVGVAFAALVWGVVLLSGELFQLVGIGVIDWLLDRDAVPWALTGLALGLGLSVAHDLRAYLSPLPALRLLRLLAPVLLVVIAVFLLALPLRGLGGLFGRLSPALLLMAVAAGAVTVISAAADRDPAGEGRAFLLRRSAMGLSLLLVPLTGLAVWAIALRVAQYGWTPTRLAGLLCALLLAAYGLIYAGAVLRGTWGAGVRQGNRWLALAVMGVAVLWLSPLLNAEALSARSQAARLLKAETLEPDMPLAELAFDWGRPGRAALERIVAARGADDPLGARIAAVLAAPDRRDALALQRGADREARLAQLEDILPLRPEGTRLPEGVLDRSGEWQIDSWAEACNRRDPAGRPGCVLIEVPFQPDLAQPQYAMLTDTGTGILALRYVLEDGQLKVRGPLLLAGEGGQPGLTRADLAAAQDGGFAITPLQRNALTLGGRQLVPNN